MAGSREREAREEEEMTVRDALGMYRDGLEEEDGEYPLIYSLVRQEGDE